MTAYERRISDWSSDVCSSDLVALATGAAKGMGLATARMFAESGASVVLADLDGDLAAKEAERIVLEGGAAIGIACDVAEEAQVAAMVDRAVAEYGRLDRKSVESGKRVSVRVDTGVRSLIKQKNKNIQQLT